MSIRGAIAQASNFTPTIEYDDAFHTYKVDGELWPSVSNVIAPFFDFTKIPPAVLNRARLRGIAVHAVVDRYNKRTGIGEMTEEVADYFRQYETFALERSPILVASESPVAHAKHRYCGRPDQVWNLDGELSMVDVKATHSVSRVSGLQLAAYAQAYSLYHGTPITKRYVLHLRRDGWTLVPFEEDSDWDVFLSALAVWRFKQGVK